MAVIIILVVLGLLAFDLYQRLYKPGLITQHWPELARHTGLMYKPALGSWSNRRSPQVTGKYRGYDIKLDLARIIPGPVDDGIAAYRTRLVLTPHGRINGAVLVEARGWFSGKGLALGHDAFDQHFRLESRPEALASRLFDASHLRQRFLEVRPRKFSLSDLGLRLEFKAGTRDAAGLRVLLNLACDLADTVKN